MKKASEDLLKWLEERQAEAILELRDLKSKNYYRRRNLKEHIKELEAACEAVEEIRKIATTDFLEKHSARQK